MKELDTNKIITAIAEEMKKLPHDKNLHYLASYGLCMNSSQFNPNAMIGSSISTIKAVMDSFIIGLKKEYTDAGKDFESVEEQFNIISIALHEIYKEYKSNGIDKEQHETDLLADLIGIGWFMIQYSMLSLNWINHDKIKEAKNS